MLNDLAVREHDDIICVLDRRKTMRDHQHRADVHHLFKRILDQKLRFGVDIRGRFVEDHDLGFMENGTRE